MWSNINVKSVEILWKQFPKTWILTNFEGENGSKKGKVSSLSILGKTDVNPVENF